MLIPTVFLVFATACAPKPPVGDPAPTACESGFILDNSSCVPESCGNGRWGNLPVDDDTVYVDLAADDGGEGTEAAPHVTIQSGLDRAGTLGGGLVAVAAGIYPETLNFSTDHSGVHLAGRCQEMVILDASVGDEWKPGIWIDAGYAVVEMSGLTLRDSSYVGLIVASGDVVVRNVAISGSASWGVKPYHPAVNGSTTLIMEGCLIDENTELGLEASGPDTQVTLLDTTVRDTQPLTNGEVGWGIEVLNGASLTAEGCLIYGNTEEGLHAANAESPGTRVTLRDTIVSDTRRDSLGKARGIEIIDGATLSVEGCLIERNTDTGLLAANAGTRIVLRDTTVRDTRQNADEEAGYGIRIQDGATLSAEGCLIEGNTDSGLYLTNPGTQATLRDMIVRDTQTRTHVGANVVSGAGIEVNDGAALSAEGCNIERNTDLGLFVVEPGTSVSLVNTTVKDTQPDKAHEAGYGIQVSEGATLLMESCRIEGNTGVGLLAGASGTVVTLRDTTVTDTLLNVYGEFGRGIGLQDGATLFAENCLIEGNAEVGLVAGEAGTRATLVGTIIRDERDLGIAVQDGATLTAEHCLIEGNAGSGLNAFDPGTRVTIRDSTISGSRPGHGRMDSAAFGVAVQDGAFLSATRLAILSNQGPGLFANSEGSSLECSECTIEGNQFAGATVVDGGTLRIFDSIIQGTTSNPNLLGGAGVYAWPWGGLPPTLAITNSLIQDNPIAGVWLIGNGSFVLTGNTISGGIGEAFGTGSRCGDAILAMDGVTAWDGTSGLLIQGNEFLDSSGAGLFLDAASAYLDGNAYSGNSVDLVAQNQSCDSLPDEYAEAPWRDLCPTYHYPTCYAEYFFEAAPANMVD